MPLYEFRCENCEKQFENIQKFSDPNPDSCPFCLKGPVQKLMSRSAFILKGTGWYETDFKGGGSKNKPSESTANVSSSGASGTPSPSTPSGENQSAPNPVPKVAPSSSTSPSP